MSIPISVLMPAYNAEKHIIESLESILNQTFPEFELLVIDDASTDRTWEIIQDCKARDNRIMAFRNQQNLGITKNRNRLISLARGEFIAWQDADDISMPTRLDKQISLLQCRPEVAIVGGYLEFFNNEKTLYTRRYAIEDSILKKIIFKQSPVAQPTAMIRKAAFQLAGFYDENLKQAEDLDMSFRIGRHYKLANLPEVLLRYRYHPGSASNRKIRENIMNTLLVRKKAVKEYGYKMDIPDRLAFFATWAAQFLPSRSIVWLFESLRKING